MEKYENLEDKKIYESVAKTIKNQKNLLSAKYSQKELIGKIREFYKLIEDHKKLLVAIGKL